MNKKKLILKEIIKETEDTNTLIFKSENSDGLTFIAGQYLNLFIDGVSKMYTISSSPEKDFIAISVKKQKNFSVKLHNLKVGDEIKYIGPFGFLCLTEIDENKKDRELVFLSAGIGITPFSSILDSEKLNGFKNKISLFYANKNKENTIFYNKFKELDEEFENFSIYHYWSDDNNKMTIEKIVDKLGNLENKIFLICGPIKFVEEYWEKLKYEGVDEDDILTESFFAQ